MKTWHDNHSHPSYSPRGARHLALALRDYRYARWHWRWGFRVMDSLCSQPAALWRRWRCRTTSRSLSRDREGAVSATPTLRKLRHEPQVSLRGQQRSLIACPTGEVSTPRSLLVVQLDHLGDAILTTAILPLLRRRFPEARLDVLASPWNRAVFQNNPHVDQILVSRRNWFERRPGLRLYLKEAVRLGLSLRRRDYDLGIDVRGDFLVALLLWMARIPRRVGWQAGGGAFLLTDALRWVPERPEMESRLALAQALGVAPERVIRPEVYPSALDRLIVSSLLEDVRNGPQWPPSGRRASATVISTSNSDRHQRVAPVPILHSGSDPCPSVTDQPPLVVLHIGAGTEAKRWPVEHFRELVRQLTQRWEARVILVGDPSEKYLGAQVAAGFHADTVLDWTGQLRVLELAALMEQADLFVGADSGPAHLAGWAGIPTVVLFSGTNRVRQWRPVGSHVHVLSHPVSCSPCHRKRCPFQDHPCMTRITPRDVSSVIEGILGSPRVQGPERMVESQVLALDPGLSALDPGPYATAQRHQNGG